MNDSIIQSSKRPRWQTLIIISGVVIAPTVILGFVSFVGTSIIAALTGLRELGAVVGTLCFGVAAALVALVGVAIRLRGPRRLDITIMALGVGCAIAGIVLLLFVGSLVMLDS
jgi:hypothetical protein